MDHAGYTWTIRAVAGEWSWAIFEPSGGPIIVGGIAPSRPVAAAMVIRAIARGVTADMRPADSLAA